MNRGNPCRWRISAWRIERRTDQEWYIHGLPLAIGETEFLLSFKPIGNIITLATILKSILVNFKGSFPYFDLILDRSKIMSLFGFREFFLGSLAGFFFYAGHNLGPPSHVNWSITPEP